MKSTNLLIIFSLIALFSQSECRSRLTPEEIKEKRKKSADSSLMQTNGRKRITGSSDKAFRKNAPAAAAPAKPAATTPPATTPTTPASSAKPAATTPSATAPATPAAPSKPAATTPPATAPATPAAPSKPASKPADSADSKPTFYDNSSSANYYTDCYYNTDTDECQEEAIKGANQLLSAALCIYNKEANKCLKNSCIVSKNKCSLVQATDISFSGIEDPSCYFDSDKLQCKHFLCAYNKSTFECVKHINTTSASSSNLLLSQDYETSSGSPCVFNSRSNSCEQASCGWDLTVQKCNFNYQNWYDPSIPFYSVTQCVFNKANGTCVPIP